MVQYRRHQQGLAAASAGALLILTAAGLPAQAAPSQDQPPAPAMRASALFAWHVSPSLARLRAEIDARWPGRSRASDGSVGDLRHQASRNSHNPVGHPGGPSYGTRGAVHALDVTAAGIDVPAVLRAVIGDPRVWYVIHDRRIWSRTYGWAARPYGGSPHTTHIHISLREDSQAAAVAAETNTSPWLSGSSGRGTAVPVSVTTPSRTPTLTTAQTKALQRALIAAGYRIPSGPTGWYGPETTRAVAAFQRDQGWRGSDADGLAGPETLRRLGVTAGGSSTPTASPTPPRTTPAPASGGTVSARSLAPGTASRDVHLMQKALLSRGYRIPAGATGYYGSRTVAAVKAFQRDQGWRGAGADGAAGPLTLQRLGLTGGSASTPTASSGSTVSASKTSTKKTEKKKTSKKKSSKKKSSRKTSSGSSTKSPSQSSSVALANLVPGTAHRDVYVLQQALLVRGYRIPAGATGYYGTRTRAAVKAFQRDQGWRGKNADGIPGRTTLKRLGL